MATIGQPIPDGTFQTFHDQEIRPITLTNYRERWLVLVFYPGDFTFICPTELEELGALYGEFQQQGAEVIGVSTDSVYVHKAWHDTSPAIKKLQFPLLSDSGGMLALGGTGRPTGCGWGIASNGAAWTGAARRARAARAADSRCSGSWASCCSLPAPVGLTCERGGSPSCLVPLSGPNL